jgi:hypothetical protein
MKITTIIHEKGIIKEFVVLNRTLIALPLKSYLPLDIQVFLDVEHMKKWSSFCKNSYYPIQNKRRVAIF